MSKVNIICMKWGDKFPPTYVNRLYAMVKRNLALDFRFVCFTDNKIGIKKEIETQPLPEINLPNNAPERGWRKLTAFKKNFGGLKGTTLFLDLDVVIVDRLDDFFTYPGDFLIAHDKKNPKKIEGNSSVFRFEIGQYHSILSNFEKNINQIRKEVRHEQAYLSNEIFKLNKLNYWPDEWVPSFKYRCCHPWPFSLFKTPFIPKGAKIILFHGLPNPPDAINGISGKWYRSIKKTHWIKDFWRE